VLCRVWVSCANSYWHWNWTRDLLTGAQQQKPTYKQSLVKIKTKNWTRFKNHCNKCYKTNFRNQNSISRIVTYLETTNHNKDINWKSSSYFGALERKNYFHLVCRKTTFNISTINFDSTWTTNFCKRSILIISQPR